MKILIHIILSVFLYTVHGWNYRCDGGSGYNTYDVHGCFNRINNRENSNESKNNINCYMSEVTRKCAFPSDTDFDKAAGHVNYWCGDKGGHQRGVCWPDCHNWQIEYDAHK